MRILISCDLHIPDDRAVAMRQIVKEWLDGDREVIVLNELVHASVEQSDGTWVRICHHEPDETSFIVDSAAS